MIVYFTGRSAATLWQMLCMPSAHWEQKDWYRGEDPSAENELARLHEFAEYKLAETKKDASGKQVGKTFKDGPQSLRKELVIRVERMINHYRKICEAGRGGVLPIQFAELTAGLKGNKPDFSTELDDPNDAEELCKLQEAAEDE